ncbi:MAG: 23S rRNA (pseudouridine(1915)-N(3))-methyltransferase RlmH, partial [Erysipelotrichaceae bacterium]|nr:23S rRNA (pseudouridine(1915)-N(3))-methyltransferase RlmH [Erysipelotrichaceae bacterium]
MIKIVAVGKIKEKYFKDAISEYVKRLSPYTKLEIIEVLDEKTSENNEGINLLAKENEGKRILSKINDDEYVIALDLHG